MRLLLRLLHVNPLPLENLLRSQIAMPESRQVALDRLLRVILDMADATVVADARDWHNHAAGTISIFLDEVLSDQPIGVCDTVLLQSLRPSHLAAVTVCFEESLLFGSDEDRLELLPKLHRYCTALPKWQGELSTLDPEELLNMS